MADANKDEVDKCKQIAQKALAEGDAVKAVRFLQKAKRMCPSDASIDGLIAAAESSGGPSGPPPAAGADSAPEGPRFRSAPGAGKPTSHAPTAGASSKGVRQTKEGHQYTGEQMQEVQRILRTKDYYEILGVPKESNEDTVKKAYKKLALKLHPDKNKAPGAEEAFKKVSRAAQCLTDEEKKTIYDRYGDEERIPQQHRQHYQQDWMTPEDLFAAFLGGGIHAHFHHGPHDEGGNTAQAQRAHMFQMLPVILLVLLTFASNFAPKDYGSKFSFQANGQYTNERVTTSLRISYFVNNDFEDHYGEGTRSLADFERQVEIYYIRQLHSECDYQEKVKYKKVMIAKRRNQEEELQKAKNHPQPACKEMEKIKRKHNSIYKSALHIGVY